MWRWNRYRDLIEEEEIAITFTQFGYIKRIPADTYKLKKEVEEEYKLCTTREEDFVEHLVTTTHIRCIILYK